MDISEQEEKQRVDEHFRMKEKSYLWDPSKPERLQAYYSWLIKQANQQQKTLELDGVTHSKGQKDYLRRQKKMYEEEAKRIKDKIEDGGR